MTAMSPLRVFQIRAPHVPLQDMDPGFEILDNTAHERPDWYEYWPIRRFLLAEALDDETFYGFLSPRFRQKTNLSAGSLSEFVRGSDAATDVVLFSPSIHNNAYYLNVFEHGDAEHAGLAAVATRFFERIGRPLDLSEFISDSRNTVLSNYFVAKPRFWREWLAVTERLFAIAETPGDALGRELCAPTSYRGRRDAQMKVFILERIATWLLVTDKAFTARVRDPFAARRRVYKLPVAIVCDALKIAYVTQGREQYKVVFLLVRTLRSLLNLQIRIGDGLGWRPVRPTLRALRKYWGANSAPGSEGSRENE
jgi:hypothetical protein